MRKEFEASGKSVEQAIDNACALAGTTVDNVDVEVLEFGGRGLFGFGHKDARVKVILEVPDPPTEKPRRERLPRREERVHDDKPRENREPKREMKKENSSEKPEPRQGQKIRENRQPNRIAKPETDAPAKQENRENKQEVKTENKQDQPRRERAPRRENKPHEEKSHREASSHSESHMVQVSEGAMAEEITAAAEMFLRPIFGKLKCNPQIEHNVRDGILWLSITGANLGLLIGRRGDTLNSLQYLTNLAVNKHRAEHVRLVLDVEGYRASREETLTVLAHKMADKAVRTGRRVEFEPMNPHERRIVHLALQNDKRVDTGSRGEEPYRRVVISKKRSDKKRPPQNAATAASVAPDASSAENKTADTAKMQQQ